MRNLNDYEVMGRKLRVDFSNEGADDDMQALIGEGGPSNNLSSVSASAGGFALPPGKDIPPGASAVDEISRVLRTLPPTQLLDVLTQMKALAGKEPARATELLAQAPQLAYAVFQALLLMELVSPEAIQSVVEGPGVGPGPGAAVAGYGYPEPAAVVPAAAVPAQVAMPIQVPVQVAPPPQQPQPAEGQSQEDLIKQVLELPQALVDQLPEAERTQLMALRMQYGVGR